MRQWETCNKGFSVISLCFEPSLFFWQMMLVLPPTSFGISYLPQNCMFKKHGISCSFQPNTKIKVFVTMMRLMSALFVLLLMIMVIEWKVWWNFHLLRSDSRSWIQVYCLHVSSIVFPKKGRQYQKKMSIKTWIVFFGIFKNVIYLSKGNLIFKDVIV